MLLVIGTHALTIITIFLPVVLGIALQAGAIDVTGVASNWAFYTSFGNFHISFHALALKSIWILFPELRLIADVAFLAVLALKTSLNGA